MKLNRIVRISLPGLLILSLLSGCSRALSPAGTVTTAWSLPSADQSTSVGGSTGSTPSSSTSRTPNTTDVPSTTDDPITSPEPVVDTERLIAELPALLEEASAPISVTEEFLRYIADVYGASVLSDIMNAFDDGSYTNQLWYSLTGNSIFVLNDLYSGAAENDTNIHFISAGVTDGENAVTTMTFGGDICFADNYKTMQYMTNANKSITDCIDLRLIAEMQSADIAFLNNEFTISDRGAPLANKAYTFRAAPGNTTLYGTLGVDIVSLANNHAYDYGAEAFQDTLDTLREYEIATIGGGMNLEEAMQPVYYLVNGRKIAYVAATRAEKNRLTPQATETTSGVLRCYDPTLFLEVIREAKANSDFVIACVHWGTEYSSVLEKAQTETARTYIDAGADLIIGSHAHQLQGIEYYNGKAIFYNLGNFWFNEKDIETGLVKVELLPDGTTRNTFLPAWQKECATTWELGTKKGSTILQHVEGYSINVTIDENGLVTERKEEQ